MELDIHDLPNRSQIEVALLQGALKEAQSRFDRLYTERSPQAMRIGRAIIQLTDWLVELSLEADQPAPLSQEGTETVRAMFGDELANTFTQDDIPYLIRAIEQLEQNALGMSKRMRMTSVQKLTHHFIGEYGPSGNPTSKSQVNLKVRKLLSRILADPEFSPERAAEILVEKREMGPELESGEVTVDPFANHTPYGELLHRLGGVLVPERVSSTNWRDSALCAQTDPELFFPETGGSTKEAKKICKNCEVREQCLEYALQHKEQDGVWGGVSPRDRRKIIKQRKAEAEQQKKDELAARRHQRVAFKLAQKATQSPV